MTEVLRDEDEDIIYTSEDTVIYLSEDPEICGIDNEGDDPDICEPPS